MTAPHIVALTEARDVLQLALSRTTDPASALRLHEAVQVAQDDLDEAKWRVALAEMSGGFLVEQAAGVRP